MQATERVTYEELIRDPEMYFRVQDEARRLRAREMWRMAQAVGHALQGEAEASRAAPELRTASCG